MRSFVQIPRRRASLHLPKLQQHLIDQDHLVGTYKVTHNPAAIARSQLLNLSHQSHEDCLTRSFESNCLPAENEKSDEDAGKKEFSQSVIGKLREVERTRQSIKWKETELALDSLAAAAKSRKPRRSFCLPRTPPKEAQSPPHTPETHMFLLVPWEEKPKKASRSPSPSLYINLPKLPFGQHKSYNEEDNLRKLIVTKRYKAWRREHKKKRTDTTIM